MKRTRSKKSRDTVPLNKYLAPAMQQCMAGVAVLYRYEYLQILTIMPACNILPSLSIFYEPRSASINPKYAATDLLA